MLESDFASTALIENKGIGSANVADEAEGVRVRRHRSVARVRVCEARTGASTERKECKRRAYTLTMSRMGHS